MAVISSELVQQPRRSRRSQRAALGRVFLLAPAVVLLLIILVYPVGRLLATSFGEGQVTLDHYRAMFGDAAVMRSFVTTLWLSVVTTVVTIVLGYPLAYLLVALPNRVARYVFVLVLLPFWISITVKSFAFIILMGRQGPINEFLLAAGIRDEPLHMLFSTTSVIFGLAHIGLPLMVFPLYATMRQIDPALMKVASSLGAKPLRAFWEVFVPLSVPGVSAGAILVFMTTIGAYVVPALLGSRHQNMVAQFIVSEVAVFRNMPLAAAITVGLLVLTSVSLIAASRVIGLDRIWDTRGRAA
jgi:ABC-type spermidine/putrescine transport system permease subunit I